MEAPRPWPTLAAPAALAVAQIAWWPLGGGAPGAVEAGAGLLAVCLAAAVLGLRRRAPVGALAGVTAVAVLGPAASFPGAPDVFGGTERTGAGDGEEYAPAIRARARYEIAGD
ncbi:hypothetical protein ACG5V6_28810, partial [Streptomyces chitinivorans]